MRETLKHELLEFQPETLQHVREACGLGAPGRVDEALALLQDWIRHQDHFLRKDFPSDFLETLLLTSKGSVEKTKQRLDLICTMRTFAPDLFAKVDLKNDFTDIHDSCNVIVLPRMTEDHYRVEIMCMRRIYPTTVQDMHQMFVIVSEYLKLHDYCNGFVSLVDLQNVNLLELVSQINLSEVRNIITLVTKGYGSRIKSIHFISPSKAIDVLIGLLKQVASPKITSRINVHKTVEELQAHVPKRILPADYGGEERSMEALYEEWLKLYASEEHVRHMREMQDAGTDEARRRSGPRDPAFGLPGTFRTLNVD